MYFGLWLRLLVLFLIGQVGGLGDNQTTEKLFSLTVVSGSDKFQVERAEKLIERAASRLKGQAPYAYLEIGN